MKEVTSQMKQLDEMIELYRSVVESREKMFWEEMEPHGITEDILIYIIRQYGYKNLSEHMNLSDIDKIFKENGSSSDKLSEEFYYSKDKSISYFDFCVNILENAVEGYDELCDVKKELEKTKTEKEDLLKNFVAALKSPEYKAARVRQINEMKERAKSADISELERTTILRRLDILAKSQDYSFLTERLQKLGKKEMDSIKNAYFDTNRGNYIMDRYQNVLKRVGINPSIHTAFFDIEETQFKDLYREYNNFFLFHIVRFISYADINNDTDYLYISSILGLLRDLATGEATQEEKESFISIVNKFYEYFDTDENKKYFKENNHAYKFHPERIRVEKEIKERRREEQKKNIRTELGTLLTTEDSEMIERDTFDVEKYLQDIISKKIEMMQELKEYYDQCNKTHTDIFFDIKEIHTYEDAYIHWEELQKIKQEESEDESKEIGLETSAESETEEFQDGNDDNAEESSENTTENGV